jgi:hypothetical protein
VPWGAWFRLARRQRLVERDPRHARYRSGDAATTSSSRRAHRHYGLVPVPRELFTLMLRELITPRLRDLGLRGSRYVYWLPCEHAWAGLGFQTQTLSGAVRFTANVFAVPKQTWELVRGDMPYVAERPNPNNQYVFTDHPVARFRISHLMNPNDPWDSWWEVHADTDCGMLAEEVLTAIADRAMPVLHDACRGRFPPKRTHPKDDGSSEPILS